MTLARALLYFATEACLNLVRSWKVNLLAVLTISVSLFVGGLFQLVSGNLAAQLEQWRKETKVIVYLQPATEPTHIEVLSEDLRVRSQGWITSLEVIDPETAQERFRELFPSLSPLLEGWDEEPLPASIEIGFDAQRIDAQLFEEWLAETRQRPEVSMVDDDRDWLAQLGTAVLVVRGVGLALALVLLAAAIFTIASVVRLTAYLYQDEIDIMRLVGSTEFFIRGPFYAEGLLQGLLGAILAAAGLFSAHRLLAARFAETSTWAQLLTQRFLPPSQVVILISIGAAAGFFGAIVSLRREKLGATEP